jgi:2-dehydro-3-deoxygluconokinase
LTPRVLCIGEGMAELSADGRGGYRLGCGGDTLNTALYMARLLGPGQVGYVTRLGDDLYSARMRAHWEAEGIDCALVETVLDTTAGLYAIDTDAAGERSFTYWRDAAPARELFTRGNWHMRTEAMASAELVYFSGISLAILPEAGRERLIGAAREAREAGAQVAVDPNFRPSLWPRDEAAQWMVRAYGAATMALVSVDEEEALFPAAGGAGPRVRSYGGGCAEVAAKDGANGVAVFAPEQVCEIPAADVNEVVDTTGAGDAFNAAYLAARLGGMDPEAAARRGCALGARVVGHRGAIIPREAMADLIGEFGHGGG